MKTPKIRISNETPLLIVMAPHEPTGDYAEQGRVMIECFERLDDDIKPHVTVQIEGKHDDSFRRNEVLLPMAEQAGVPITLQVQTNNSDVKDTLPMETARRMVDRFDCIVGLQIVEASVRTFVDHGGGMEYTLGRNARYARDTITLCAEYGLFMSWQQMTENAAALACSVDNEALFETVREHGDLVIPTHEMNCETSKYICHLSSMGLWASGVTAQWGVEAQSWYWWDAGYEAPGAFLPGTTNMPGSVWAIMFLLGASAGATVYSVEPGNEFWHRGDEWIIPTFRRLVKERLIPSRDEVIAASPLAYHLPKCQTPQDFHAISRDLDFDRHEGRLVGATYGVFDRARDAEMIPNTPRYGWIPVLPAKTSQSVLDRFERVIVPGELQSVEHAKKVADEHFPVVDRGEAWSQMVGPLAVAVNTHENWYEPESIKLELPRRPTGVSLSEGNDGWSLSWDQGDGDQYYRVWRFRDGVETEISGSVVVDAQFDLPEKLPGDLFAVSAVTDAKETIEETLHLHEFLMYSRKESMRSLWVDVDGRQMASHRFGEAVLPVSPDVLTSESRCASCTAVEDLLSPEVAADDPQAQLKRDVMSAMIGWKRAIEAEDIDRILSCYAHDYSEPDGRTTESVEVAFRSLFRRYQPEANERLLKEWGSIEAWHFPTLRLLVRTWVSVASDRVELDVVAEMRAGGGPEMEPSDIFFHPFSDRSKTLRMVWTRQQGCWEIAKTSPPFLRMEDLGMFRFRYQGW